MGNMSYCRFQNTSGDLRECKDALEDLISGDSGPLSMDETHAARRLACTAVDLVLILLEAAGKEIPDVLEELEPGDVIDTANAECEARNDEAKENEK